LKAARTLGLEVVPVRFLDIDPDEARALALADNKLGEIALWDEGLLSEVLLELEQTGLDLDGLGWDGDALGDLLQPVPELNLSDYNTNTDHVAGESDFSIRRMSIPKADIPEVDRAVRSEWGDPDAPKGGADRLGALFLHLWRTRAV